MNYYIIPKNNFNIKISLTIRHDNIAPIMSYSLIHFLNDIYTQILHIVSNDTNEQTLEYITKIVNPYEFIHTNIPGTDLSVSKLKLHSNIFFELLELFQSCNIMEPLLSKKQVNIAHITRNHSDTNHLINMFHEPNSECSSNNIIINEDFHFKTLCDRFIVNPVYKDKMDLFIFEFLEGDYINTPQYINNMILVLYIVTKHQADNGTCIIKMDNIFYKTIVDILFIFSAIFERVIIIKPSISKVTKGERYLICKNLNIDSIRQTKLLQQLEEVCKPKIIDNTLNMFQIHSLIKNDIPYYFSNKLEEINAVIGQQQLEVYDHILNIYKNKNRNEKCEIMKRNHIQKCVQWCEKNQIPCNKFIDNTNTNNNNNTNNNIFLNMKNRVLINDNQNVELIIEEEKEENEEEDIIALVNEMVDFVINDK
jgi:hypothetical protein